MQLRQELRLLVIESVPDSAIPDLNVSGQVQLVIRKRFNRKEVEIRKWEIRKPRSGHQLI